MQLFNARLESSNVQTDGSACYIALADGHEDDDDDDDDDDVMEGGDGDVEDGGEGDDCYLDDLLSHG